MSLTNLKILAQTSAVMNNDNVLVFRTAYRPQVPVGNHTDGVVDTIVGDLTETGFNLQMAQAVADRCNLESSNLEEFTAADVIGGRI